MLRVVVASTNPVKIKAVANGFKAMFPSDEVILTGANVASGVSNQPMTDFETLSGAVNRANRAMDTLHDVDYWVGVEGGVQVIQEELSAFAWVVIRNRISIGKARTGAFFLPPAVVTLIHAGKELGEADDIVFNRKNSKQENGAIGILTDNIIDRADFYVPAVIMALIPFKNPELY